MPYPPAGCTWINVPDKQKITLIEAGEDLRSYDETYHEAWTELFHKLKLKTSDGYEYYLDDINGKLWLVCPSKMSDDEYVKLFDEPIIFDY